MHTVITKGNKVHLVDSVYYGSVDDIIIIYENGHIKVKKGNPITWPTDATNGLQAIVDVKAGTLRFGHNKLINLTEFVVSEYDDANTFKHFTSIEDSQPAPHIFDLIDNWPDQRNLRPGVEAPKGYEWKYFGDDWTLSNGTACLTHDDWFKYRFVEPEPLPAVELGTKADSGKPMMGCIPPHAELAVARVLTFGAHKYSRGNWAHVENSDERYMDAALRHINAYRRGENTDSETSESHLAHAICCLMFMLDKLESK